MATKLSMISVKASYSICIDFGFLYIKVGCFNLMVASWMFLYSNSSNIKNCIATVCKCVQLYVVKSV